MGGRGDDAIEVRHWQTLNQLTSLCRVDAEALVPETADQDVAVVGRDHEAVRVDLDALVHQVGDLTLVHARVVCCVGGGTQRWVDEGIKKVVLTVRPMNSDLL